MRTSERRRKFSNVFWQTKQALRNSGYEDATTEEIKEYLSSGELPCRQFGPTTFSSLPDAFRYLNEINNEDMPEAVPLPDTPTSLEGIFTQPSLAGELDATSLEDIQELLNIDVPPQPLFDAEPDTTPLDDLISQALEDFPEVANDNEEKANADDLCTVEAPFGSLCEDIGQEKRTTDANDKENVGVQLQQLLNHIVERCIDVNTTQSSEIQKKALRVTQENMRTLKGSRWLNDSIINPYMTLIAERTPKEGQPKVHTMNTFFYTRLTTGRHPSVRRWTKNIDIFAVDLILVPVHLGNHWCLATINNPKKTIRYYDSLLNPNKNCLITLKEYLMAEHLDKEGTILDFSGWKMRHAARIPRQTNSHDCGIFACQYAKAIATNRKITFTQQSVKKLRATMAQEITAEYLL
ncbi:sentrin-specific protease-like [Hylaeus volcanicus]|uniref:sentrin-specific protease-like n=1 Tax=Hylaeus volcanicus TaxID=313075 RepID=UPI0023B876B8|nr:sentrin-specific protease-like [Hylaeus volcanicus]